MVRSFSCSARTPSRGFESAVGATILEFALIVPVLFMLIFGIIDLAVALTSQAVLNTAAQRAVAYLATAPTIDKSCCTSTCGTGGQPACSATVQDCRNRCQDELARARTIATELPFSTSFFTSQLSVKSFARSYIDSAADVTFVFPPGTPRESAFQQEPIYVDIRAHRDSILLGWIPGLAFLDDIKVTAGGWREPMKLVRNPIAQTCSAAAPETCPCLGDPGSTKAGVLDANGVLTQSCVCRGNLVPQDAPTSSPGSPVANGTACVCPSGQNPSETDPTQCAPCACGPGHAVDSDGNCHQCGTGWYTSPGSCNATGCNECVADFGWGFVPNDDQSACVSCGIAHPCAPGQGVSSDEHELDVCTCVNCGAGEASDGTTTCVNCSDSNQAPSADHSQCVTCGTECNPGFRQTPGCQGCVPCEDGTYHAYSSGAATCNQCNAGQTSNSTHTDCVDCQTGCRPGQGLTTNCGCENCTGNYASNGNEECHWCSNGTTPNGSHSDCVSCTSINPLRDDRHYYDLSDYNGTSCGQGTCTSLHVRDPNDVGSCICESGCAPGETQDPNTCQCQGGDGE